MASVRSPDVDGQQQLALRVHRRPHPVGRARQALDRLGLADLAGLHRAEQGKELIELDLRDAHVVQEILREGRGMVRHFDQPVQHRIGVHLKHPGYSADAQALYHLRSVELG